MANLAKQAQAERVTKVDRKRLLETLIKNKEAHIQEYQKALTGYAQMAQQKADEAFQDAEKKLNKAKQKFVENISKFDINKPDSSKNISGTLLDSVYLDLPVPKNFSDAYDTAITQMDWETEDTVEITTAEIECFIRDRWTWSDSFVTSNSMYLGG